MMENQNFLPTPSHGENSLFWFIFLILPVIVKMISLNSHRQNSPVSNNL